MALQGMNRKIDGLHSFVPLQGIPQQHLEFLLDKASSYFVLKGASVETDQFGSEVIVYLYSGEVEITYPNGELQNVNANTNLLPLAYQAQSTVKLTAVSDSELLIFPVDDLRKQLCWSQMAEFQRVQIAGDPTRDEDAEWINFILDSNLFFKVPPTNVADIFSKLTPKVVSAGDVIVRQGEIGNACFFIKEGRARVDIYDPMTQISATVAEIAAGRCFGEDALVNKTKRNATVTMIENGVLMRLAKDDFLPLMEEESSPKVELKYLLPLIRGLSEAKSAEESTKILVDVRTSPEYEVSHLRNAVNISLDLLPLHLPRLDTSAEYVFYSDTGFRSDAAALVLSKLGYKAMSLAGGFKKVLSKCLVNPEWQKLISDQSYWLRGGQVVADQSSATIK
ncbi:hypothetical protein MAH4_09940 [Sessilibacter sp. MAH4]